MAGRRQSVTYGHWELVPLGERAFKLVYEEEYMWIESAISGAGLGTFEACGLPMQTELCLVDRFNGSCVYSW